MEFKTTTSGDTILHLEDWERDLLMQRASQHGDMAMAEAMNRLDRVRRQNPHQTQFAAILDLAFPAQQPAQTAGVVSRRKPKSDPLAETTEIEALIRNKLGSANSMQVEAVLLQALATVNQTRVMAKLRNGE